MYHPSVILSVCMINRGKLSNAMANIQIAEMDYIFFAGYPNANLLGGAGVHQHAGVVDDGTDLALGDKLVDGGAGQTTGDLEAL